MSNTLRTVRFPEADGTIRVQQRAEVDSRWRADRDERLVRLHRDEKRLERADRHDAIADDAEIWPIGSTVRVIS